MREKKINSFKKSKEKIKKNSNEREMNLPGNKQKTGRDELLNSTKDKLKEKKSR
jgi:hypothetical protein